MRRGCLLRSTPTNPGQQDGDRRSVGVPRAQRPSPMTSQFPGGHRIRVTPVPIPNTEVKPDTADGTVWETVWESRSLPGLFITRSLGTIDVERYAPLVGGAARRRTPGTKFAGGHRSRVTPVPIPNTEVKPATADGTMWETAWESRSLPALF